MRSFCVLLLIFRSLIAVHIIAALIFVKCTVIHVRQASRSAGMQIQFELKCCASNDPRVTSARLARLAQTALELSLLQPI